MTDKLKEKASIAELNDLHALVAKSLASNLDDPRVLAQAIKFLKDNNITTDIISSDNTISLADSIKKLAASNNYEADDISIEDLLNA